MATETRTVARKTATNTAMSMARGMSNEADFVTDSAHSNVMGLLKDHASHHATKNGPAILELLGREFKSGSERETAILDAFRQMSANPEVIARLIDGALKDLKDKNNGHQMLRYLLNTSYEKLVNRHAPIQEAAIRVVASPDVQDSGTLQKFLAVAEDTFTAGQLKTILNKKGLSSGAKVEAVLANGDLEDGNTRRMLTAYLQKGSDRVAASLIDLALNPTDKEKQDAAATALPVRHYALGRLNDALGLEADVPVGTTLATLIAFKPDGKNPEDVAKAAEVMRGGMTAMGLDPVHGQTVYELAITALYNPEVEKESEQAWTQTGVQRQLAKNLVALARRGERTGDMSAFIKTMTWYEGTLTGAQVSAVLKRDIDPSIVHEMFISDNVDLSRATHYDRVKMLFVAVVDANPSASANHKASAEIARKALADQRRKEQEETTTVQ